MSITTESLIEALYKVEGKAEIVNGELQLMPPSGDLPVSAAGAIYISLHAYSKHTRKGRAYTDGTGFLVDLPNRKSFSPDVAFHTGERTGMKFLKGAPAFAVEVRSENDYGRKAETNMAQKRADYFAAGTLVVWDVDVLSDDVIRVYRSRDPLHPAIYRRNQTAEAEPAVPGWTFPVDELFGWGPDDTIVFSLRSTQTSPRCASSLHTCIAGRTRNFAPVQEAVDDAFRVGIAAKMSATVILIFAGSRRTRSAFCHSHRSREPIP